MTSPRQAKVQHAPSSSPQEPSLHESLLITELVLVQVEQKVVEFEVEREQVKSWERLASKQPDYSWLISADMKPKKYLTLQVKQNKYTKKLEHLGKVQVGAGL